MDQRNGLTRRRALGVGIGGLGLAAAAAPRPAIGSSQLRDLDPIRTELVMDLIVTCSAPEPIGSNGASKDGMRSEVWPIIGGRFEGPLIRGTVEPGGGDYPVKRPDGVEVIDALYRLRTDDGQIIIIHNKGLTYPGRSGEWPKFRLVPEFIAPVGRYDWLNKSIFLSTLVAPPRAMALASGSNQNDRLIQVHRVY